MSNLLRWLGATYAAGCVLALPATAAQKNEVIRVDSVVTAFHKIVVTPGTTGDSAGDSFQFTDKLSAHKRTVGHDAASCVHTDAIYYECAWTVILHGGSFQIQGLDRDTNKAVALAIVGGTGRYARARGTMVVTDALKAMAHYKLSFHRV